MSFRYGQSGSVSRKGQMWRGRYYVDVPGQDKRRKVAVQLGSIHNMTKSQARRKLRSLIEERGLNKDSPLERVEAGARSFASEVAWWRENKLAVLKPSCQETMGGHLDKYLLPRFGSLPSAAIDERRVQEFIAELVRTDYVKPNGIRKKLSPKSICNIIGVLKLILGKKVWREWTLSLPKNPDTEQRCFSPEEMLQIINVAKGQWKALFATLASTGMRCGEAFGLHVEDLDLQAARIFIRRSIWNGQEVAVKTKWGYRAITIEPSLCDMLNAHLGGRRGGRVFQTRNGTPFCKSNVRRKLNEILKSLKLKPAGLHAFRHGRVSVLQANGVPGDLVKEWVGHSSLRTTSRYTHFQDDFRKQVATETGLFTRSNQSGKTIVGPLGPPSVSFAANMSAA
ncbi:MAG: tyrosine-type recombinase/integrase [Candidatus Sulfotelmatobacter sp.]